VVVFETEEADVEMEVNENLIEDLILFINSSEDAVPEVDEHHAVAFDFEDENVPEVAVDAGTAKTKEALVDELQCAICKKIMSCKRNLKIHIESVHEKKKRFDCPHCPKRCYYKSDLEKHIACRHIFTNDDTSNQHRPFKCEVKGCAKFFKTKDNLRYHQRRSGHR
jgi:uncharacterized Zn-finger protein